MNSEELYEAGDIYIDKEGNRWLKLACGRWALIFDDIVEESKELH